MKGFGRRTLYSGNVASPSRNRFHQTGLSLHYTMKAIFPLCGTARAQLIGPNGILNPLETFIFGGAVLLHDVGHAVATYDGGIAELKQTKEYQDAVAAILRKDGQNPPQRCDIENPPEEIGKAGLFTAVRRLHAKQAETIAGRAFDGKYLIDDSEIRDNLAELIGQIAASHQWDRQILETKFVKVQGPPGFMPSEWSVEPVKIACLLRCADAIQIDQRRAPAFRMALHAPIGQSKLHWLAQQLAQPVIETQGNQRPSALAFTPQCDFKEEDADAWWIAYDLVRTANDALQGCYQLMDEIGLPTFTLDRVLGADSPSHLANYIRTDGWQPVSAEVRVTSVEQIIRLFGGELLYGRKNLSTVLRELIQNASDAIRARRKLFGDQFYGGIISITLSENRDHFVLTVEDDGIGMSQSVLVGPLIEFGKTFWNSAEAQNEFPGLLSSGFRHNGRYGIGFFSVLTVTDDVSVTSRRWDSAQDSARTLTFREGLRLRPLLSENHDALLGQFSTRVALRVAKDIVEFGTYS